MYFPRSRARTSARAHRPPAQIGALSLAAVLLTTILAFGCADSIPTGPEEDPGVEAFGPAAAAKGGPARTGILTRATFPNDNVCGIPVTTEVFEAGTEWELLPGGVLSKETGILRVTWTADNGQSVQLHAAGQASREVTAWIDEEAGLFTGTETVKGLARAIKSPQGPASYRDVGKIVFGFPLIQLLDGGGFAVLEPPVILEVSGPHPEAEGNATFCEAVTEALS
jgi:hypothetical protein